MGDNDSGSQHPQDPLGALVGARIRELRLSAGTPLTEVARTAGVSRRMLTLIEHGGANPSVLTLDRVAAALGTDVAHLVLRPGEHAPVAFRSSDAVDVVALPSGGRAQLRARTTRPNGPELWTWVLQPGDAHDVAATEQGLEQLFLVTEGQLDIITGTDVLTLSTGDSAVTRTDVSHRYANSGAGTCRFVQVSQSAAR